MRQTIQRQALKAHFVPTTTEAATYALGGRRGQSQSTDNQTLMSPAPQGVRTHAAGPRTLRQTALRAASTVLWAIAGEKAFARAMSPRDVPAAVVGGSLAAVTAYVQERRARRTSLVSPHAASKRSLLSFYAVMGMGLGLGAMLVNRRRD